jgi:hypothetical protein
MIVFALVEWKQGEGAMVVPRIIKRRSILVLALFNLTAQGSGFARVYNLPIFFQAGQGQSPSESGIRTLPTVLTTCKCCRPSLVPCLRRTYPSPLQISHF